MMILQSHWSLQDRPRKFDLVTRPFLARKWTLARHDCHLVGSRLNLARHHSVQYILYRPNLIFSYFNLSKLAMQSINQNRTLACSVHEYSPTYQSQENLEEISPVPELCTQLYLLHAQKLLVNMHTKFI